VLGATGGGASPSRGAPHGALGSARGAPWWRGHALQRLVAAQRGDGATPVTVGSSEHVHEVEHDAAKAVVLAVGRKGARS
jgi:hypothetical protein